MEKYISLKICGNPQANSGFSTLLNLNNAYFEVIDKFDVGMAENPFYFSFVVDDRQIVYKLIKNNVRSLGAARMGSLVFAIGVPRGYVLGNGNSPFSVLMRIKDEFLLKYMVCRDPQTETYEFNGAPVDTAVFDAIIRENPLETFLGPWFAMTPHMPQGCVELSPEMTDIFLSDVQYPENTRVSEVFVAPRIQPSAPLVRLNPVIPQQTVYSVTVNGQPFKQTRDIDDPVSVELKETSNYHASVVAFTFRELKQGKQIAGVAYDPQKETAAVSITQAPKTESFKIEVDSARLFANPAGLHVMVGNRTEQVRPDMTLVVPRSEAASLQFVYDGPDYEIADWQVQDDKIMIAVRPKRVEPVVTPVIPQPVPVPPVAAPDKKRPALMLILGIVIGLLIGLLAGFLLIPKGGSEVPPVEEENSDFIEETKQGTEDSYDAKAERMNDWRDQLSKDDVEFEKIKEIYRASNEDADYYRDNCNEDFDVIARYNSFVNNVQSGDYDVVVRSVSEVSNVLTPSQKDKVQSYFVANGRRSVENQAHYNLNYNNFRSFTDLSTEFGDHPVVESSEHPTRDGGGSGSGNVSGDGQTVNQTEPPVQEQPEDR